MTFRKKKLIYLNVCFAIVFICGITFIILANFLRIITDMYPMIMMSSVGPAMISASVAFWTWETKYYLRLDKEEFGDNKTIMENIKSLKDDLMNKPPTT